LNNSNTPHPTQFKTFLVMRKTSLQVLIACYLLFHSLVANAQCSNNVFNALAMSGSKILGATNNGLFVSTNNGVNWNRVEAAGIRDADVRHLVIEGALVLAATYGHGLFRSTDEGISWTRINLGYNAIYFTSITMSGSSIIANAGNDGFFVSNNNGLNWQRMAAPEPYQLLPVAINSAMEMRDAYNLALSGKDACLLYGLAVVENNANYLADVKAGDMLAQSYQWAVQQNMAQLLFAIAQFENSAKIMQQQAGNILHASYTMAVSQQNARLLFEIARWENKVQLIDAKAGDVLMNAYQYSRAQKDQHLLFDVARYEKEYDLMNTTTAATVLWDAYQAAIAAKDYHTLFQIADYEAAEDILTNMSAEEIRRKARIIQLGG
jgi:hypothetical protein